MGRAIKPKSMMPCVSMWRTMPMNNIEESNIIRLSLEDQRVVADMLSNPSPPNAALKRAAKAYRELFAGQLAREAALDKLSDLDQELGLM